VTVNLKKLQRTCLEATARASPQGAERRDAGLVLLPVGNMQDDPISWSR